MDTQQPLSVVPDPDALFDAEWLAMRAGADAVARSLDLTRLARQYVLDRRKPGVPLRCVDLGCGSGANAAYLTSRLPGPQQWLLLDHDQTLLERAVERSRQWCDEDGAPVQLEARCCDLRALTSAQIEGADLVTTSALIDLVGADWLPKLAHACRHAQAALLVVLSVDGEWRLMASGSSADDPEIDVDDALVRAAFNDHQRRDKGVGGALGPDAVTTFAAVLRDSGFDVHLAASPWRLQLDEPVQRALASALIDGWRDAAMAQCPQAASRIADWHMRRLARVRGGGGVLEVGHVDLLALPAAQAAPRSS